MRTEQGIINRNAYRAKYDKENTKQIKFKFNLRTDADILEWLSLQPNTQGYIKRIIRDDMARLKKD